MKRIIVILLTSIALISCNKKESVSSESTLIIESIDTGRLHVIVNDNVYFSENIQGVKEIELPESGKVEAYFSYNKGESLMLISKNSQVFTSKRYRIFDSDGNEYNRLAINANLY